MDGSYFGPPTTWLNKHKSFIEKGEAGMINSQEISVTPPRGTHTGPDPDPAMQGRREKEGGRTGAGGRTLWNCILHPIDARRKSLLPSSKPLHQSAGHRGQRRNTTYGHPSFVGLHCLLSVFSAARLRQQSFLDSHTDAPCGTTHAPGHIHPLELK